MDVLTYAVKRYELLWEVMIDHMEMALLAIVVAIFAGLILGIVISWVDLLAKPIISVVNVIQTIPALALFALLMPVMGIGAGAGIVGLTLYAILPILKNTHAGIRAVDRVLLETGRGIGMTDMQLLLKVQLPLAFPVIMAGIRTSAVIAIGMTTLVALIGGSGLGKIIYRGISRVDNAEIMTGAILSALLAIAADAALGKIENRMR